MSLKRGRAICALQRLSCGVLFNFVQQKESSAPTNLSAPIGNCSSGAGTSSLFRGLRWHDQLRQFGKQLEGIACIDQRSTREPVGNRRADCDIRCNRDGDGSDRVSMAKEWRQQCGCNRDQLHHTCYQPRR